MITRRTVTVLVIIFTVAFLVGLLFISYAPAFPSDSDPVLLVHGWGLNTWITWPLMEPRLEEDGYEVYTIDFSDNIGSNTVNAEELSAKVEEILAETGEPKVDIVAHSMGGISTRYYIKYLGGEAKINDVVELGTPNHGTLVAFLGYMFSEGAREVVPLSPFLLDLNSSDETPGPVKWTSIWTIFDEVNIPSINSILDGAHNLMVWWPVGHLGLTWDLTTYEWVVEGLEGAGENIN